MSSSPPPAAQRPGASVHSVLKEPRLERSGGEAAGSGKPDQKTPELAPARHPSQPPLQPPQDPTEILLRSYRQALQQGFIEYNPPAQMTVGTSATIIVRVARNRMPQLPGQALALPGQTTNTLSVYPKMRVALTTNSGAAFAITPDAAFPDTQTVPDAGFAEWHWQVVPLLAGADKTLVVTAWAALDDPILIQEFVAEVNVQVAPPPPPPTIGQRIQAFVSKNWQWLWAVILIPSLGWLSRLFKRKKKDDVS